MLSRLRALVLLISAFMCSAQAAGAARRAVLVLRPEFTAEAVFQPGSPFASLLPRAAVGVMNVAVRGAREPASAYLCLGAGERLASGPLDRPARFASEIVEGDPAAVVYERRMGPLPAAPLPLSASSPRARTSVSPPALLQLEWAAYRNAPDPTYTPGELHAAGGLGQALRPYGGAAWVGVDEAARTRWGALAALDARGTVPWAVQVFRRAGVQAFGRAGVRRSARVARTERTDRTDRTKPPALFPERPNAQDHRFAVVPPERLTARPPERLNAQTPPPAIAATVTALLRRAPLVVVDLPASFPVPRLAELVAGLSAEPGRDVLLVSPFPPPGPGGAWDRLTPVLAFGPEFRPGRLTSATTRTAGLVANIDVAPTLLSALGVPAPPTMSGRVMRSQPQEHGRGGLAAAAEVRRFAQAATLSTRGIIPVGVALEAASVLLLGLIVLALRRPPPLAGSRPRPSLAALASAGMLFIASVPLGLLLGPVTEPRTVLELGIAVALWAAVAAGAAFGASRLCLLIRSIAAPREAREESRGHQERPLDSERSSGGAASAWGPRKSEGFPGSAGVSPASVRAGETPALPGPALGGFRTSWNRAAAAAPASPSPLLWLAGLTVLVVAGDLLAGGTLIARSPLSGFPVIGIRFYGIGNEYLGVLIGMGLVAPLAFEEHLRRYRWAQAALYLGLLVLISAPRYGANFGGALAGAAGFGAALAMAARPRRPGRALLLAGAALLLAGAGALLWDALRPAAERTHIGDFAHAVWTSGWAAAAPVLRRKAAMDLRLLTSGYAAVPIAIVFPLVAFWYRGAGRGIAALLARRPELRAMAAGALVGAWTGLFLKDSGVAPWMLIQGSLLAVLLDEQLRNYQPSTTHSPLPALRHSRPAPGESDSGR